VSFRLFMPLEATLMRSILLTIGWSAIHIVRRN
jgi:hypothetical protein